jgi:biofilm protein TabA
MIIAPLKNIEQQVVMTPAFRQAIDFLNRTDLAGLSDGKVEIDGDAVFAIVQRYETASATDPKFEYHRKYADIQIIVSGKEVIGWAPIERMMVSEEYDAGRDIAFGSVGSREWTPVLLKAGDAAVLYPEDGHAPKLSAGAASPVMKIVVKVAVGDWSR